MTKKSTPIALITGITAICLVTMMPGFASSATFYPHGLYIGVGIGGAMINGDDFTCDLGSCTKIAGATQLKSKGSPAAMVHVGYAAEHFPIQFEIAYQYFYQFSYDESNVQNSGDSLESDVTNQTAFANVMLFGNFFNTPIIPYIMAGFGANFNVVKTEYKVDASSTNDDSLDASNRQIQRAWQIGFGANYRMTDNWFLILSYRYQNLGTVTWNLNNSNTQTEFSSKNLTDSRGEIGIAYYFGDQHRPPSLIDTDD